MVEIAFLSENVNIIFWYFRIAVVKSFWAKLRSCVELILFPRKYY